MPLLDAARIGKLPLTSATRTIIDLARSESDDRLTTALDSALRDGLTSEEFLQGRTVRVDCRFVDVPLVVELLGYRWHRTKAQMERDAQRTNALQLAGFAVLQFTYERIALYPSTVVNEVAEALAQLTPRGLTA